MLNAYSILTNTLAHLFRTPPYLILFVSEKCWLSCRHCWYNEAWKTGNLGGPPLSFSELERLAGSIRSISFLTLTGGEAFLRQDLVEIAKVFSKKTRLRRYQVPTSGFDPDLVMSQTERLLESMPDIPFRVDVSLDGSEATHDYIRNAPGAYRQALSTIAGLNRLKRTHRHFDVGVITTISHYNQDEVRHIGRIVEKANPNGEWMVNVTRGLPRDPSASAVDPEKYFEAHRIIDRRIRQKRYSGHSGHFLAPWLTAKNITRRKVIKSILDNCYQGGACAAGSLGGVVYTDGTVAACELLDRPFGNLRDVGCDLSRLWLSATADVIRKEIQESRCCCTQECFLSVSLLIQPRYVLDIIRERARLSRAAGQAYEEG